MTGEDALGMSTGEGQMDMETRVHFHGRIDTETRVRFHGLCKRGEAGGGWVEGVEKLRWTQE